MIDDPTGLQMLIQFGVSAIVGLAIGLPIGLFVGYDQRKK